MLIVIYLPFQKKINEIIGEINKAVIGKSDIIVKVLMTIISNGHILIEDMPGVGKTTMALAFFQSTFTGIQANAIYT